MGFFLHDVLCVNQHGGPRQRISPWKRRTEKRKGLQRQVFKGKYCYIVFIFGSLRIWYPTLITISFITDRSEVS